MKQKKPQKPKEQEEPTCSEPARPEQGRRVEPKAEKSELEKLRQQIEDLQKEKDELFGKLQRVSADYINFQKRTHKQVADTIAYEKEKIIKTLLPALDNFEHTLQNAQSTVRCPQAEAENADVLIEGIRIIYDQILDILKAHGVERIEALGEKFDPALHEAVSQKAESGKEDNIVLEEFQKGYKLNGRVIRPSRVIINKHAVSASPPTPSCQRQEWGGGGQQEHSEQEQTTDESTGAE
jgi:molecular chaperone GrpE